MAAFTVVTPVRHCAAGDVLVRSREIYDPALREAVGSLPDPLGRMAGYHLGWCDTAGIPVETDSGKGCARPRRSPQRSPVAVIHCWRCLRLSQSS
jgi:hypothetical protein